MESYWIVSMS